MRLEYPLHFDACPLVFKLSISCVFQDDLSVRQFITHLNIEGSVGPGI